MDIGIKGFILLKHPKTKPVNFKCGDAYLADKIKVIINRLGEVCLVSSSLTVLRVESEETHTIESMELSQKQYTHRQAIAEEQEKIERERAIFANVTDKTNLMLMNDDLKFDSTFKTSSNPANNGVQNGDHNQNAASGLRQSAAG